MRKTCEGCGEEFEAQRATARTCSDRCRQRARRRSGAAAARVTDVSETISAPDEAFSGPQGSVFASTRAELEAAGRLGTAAGGAVLALARRIDTGAQSETGAGLAALVREFRAALADVLAGAEPAADPLDELRARRERRLNAG